MIYISFVESIGALPSIQTQSACESERPYRGTAMKQYPSNRVLRHQQVILAASAEKEAFFPSNVKRKRGYTDRIFESYNDDIFYNCAFRMSSANSLLLGYAPFGNDTPFFFTYF